MQNRFKITALAIALPFGLVAVSSTDALAQSRDEFPFSIMQPEPGTRRAPPPKRVTAPPQARPAQKAAKAQPRRVRGSSTASTIPTFRSPLTPLGTAPKLGTAPSMANPGSPAAQVPGISTTGGAPAMTPPRPAGQGFQDRASSCVSGSTGVAPGQVGSFTGACVNR